EGGSCPLPSHARSLTGLLPLANSAPACPCRLDLAAPDLGPCRRCRHFSSKTGDSQAKPAAGCSREIAPEARDGLVVACAKRPAPTALPESGCSLRASLMATPTKSAPMARASHALRRRDVLEAANRPVNHATAMFHVVPTTLNSSPSTRNAATFEGASTLTNWG